MTFFTAWLSVAIICWLGAMIPGASFAVILKTSVSSTRANGVLTAIGLGLGMSVHACLVVFGVALIIVHHAWLGTTIKWLGVLYLLYLGINCLRAKRKTKDELKFAALHNKTAVWKSIRTGFITTIMNPKVLLFFLALFSQFIHPGVPVIHQVTFIVTIMAIEFLWFAFVALVLTHSALQKRYFHIAHWIERAAGVVLIALALELAFSHLM